MKDLKVYAICDGCNKEIEVPIGENGYAIASNCPLCGHLNRLWMRIVVTENTKEAK